MELTSILSLVRAHNLSAYVVGREVVAESVVVDAGTLVASTERVTFREGCRRSEVLAWLGY